jgi:hypothetical protein
MGLVLSSEDGHEREAAQDRPSNRALILVIWEGYAQDDARRGPADEYGQYLVTISGHLTKCGYRGASFKGIMKNSERTSGFSDSIAICLYTEDGGDPTSDRSTTPRAIWTHICPAKRTEAQAFKCVAAGENADEFNHPQSGRADSDRVPRRGDWHSAVDVHAEKADAEAPFQIWPRIRQSHR